MDICYSFSNISDAGSVRQPICDALALAEVLFLPKAFAIVQIDLFVYRARRKAEHLRRAESLRRRIRNAANISVVPEKQGILALRSLCVVCGGGGGGGGGATKEGGAPLFCPPPPPHTSFAMQEHLAFRERR